MKKHMVTDVDGQGGHTLVINWAVDVTETIYLPAGVGAFNVNHAFGESGGYTVSVRVTDEGGLEDVLNLTVRVAVPGYKLYLPLL